MEKTAYAHATYAPPPREGSILQLPIEQIYAEKGVNKALKRNESIRLARSIQKYGVSTPVVVTPTEVFPNFYRYSIQKGAEIWHAACIAGLKTLPCLIANAPSQDPEVVEILSKIRARALHIFEQAAAFRYLTEELGLSRATLARETGFSQSAIANKLRLCRLSHAEQQEILRAGLTERHARAILRLTEPEKRRAVLQVIAREKMSVAAAELLVEATLMGGMGENALQKPKTEEKEGQEKPLARKIPVSKPATGSICPKKFALHTLQPLYNSIERTLSIFRKTGYNAEMRAQEGADGVLITIHIPPIS